MVFVLIVFDLALNAVAGDFVRELALSDAEMNNRRAYIETAYHHDLVPNVDMQRQWGSTEYRHVTDEFGNRTGARRDSMMPARIVFVIGDSFIEGLGVDYENSVAGLLAEELKQRGIRVMNLGVASYSPSIYHRKIKRIIREIGRKPESVVVFLDISDIQDDGEKYFERDGVVHSRDRGSVKQKLKKYSLVVWVLDQIKDRMFTLSAGLSDDKSRRMIDPDRGRWTIDRELFDRYGRIGLENSAKHLQAIADLCGSIGCEFTLVVYPWPDQILADDENSIQVRYWQKWSESHGVRFINLFPVFFEEAAATTVAKYFVANDVHWNLAGNRLIYNQFLTRWGSHQ
jgi:lysophospholipase L1-like esterase